MEHVRETIKQKLSVLPEQPGCYLMKHSNGDIIYVGKAKVLKNRVRSYFTGSHDIKTQRLVSEIADFEYIITSSNAEALILECNLIKKYQPRYNVLLKDDKTFPYIKITSHEHPRLEVTRKIVKDKAKYFGPYPNVYAAQQTKKLLDKLYPLRKCRQLPDRVCLYYHMGQCLAPCVNTVSAEKNDQMVKEITRFLNGGQEEIKQTLHSQMLEASENLNFERASELRDQIAAINAVIQKQNITTADNIDRDIFGCAVDKGWMCVQILYMRQGKMLERHASVFPYYGDKQADFHSYVAQYYSENPALPKEILLPMMDDDEEGVPSDENDSGNNDIGEALVSWLQVKVHTPQRGLKKQMIDMAEKNATNAIEEKFRLLERDQTRTIQASKNLGEWIGAGNLHRIEAFDNSNIQGSAPVSAMVVFIDGKPSRKDYRKYKIKTVKGANDVATMKEVVRRRYERALKENLSLPDLIVVDGGKTQIAAAVDVLENELGLFIPVCGLAKDDKHRTSELLMGDPPTVIDIPRTSPEFYLLQRIQEEVHRFAITFHRETRGKSMVRSRLDSIPGVGPKRRNKLLKHFGSLKKIKEAGAEDFRPLGIGENLAQQIMEALKDQEKNSDAQP